MTTTQDVYVVGVDPENATDNAATHYSKNGHTVIWVGVPVPIPAIGLITGLTLYKVRVVFRWSAR